MNDKGRLCRFIDLLLWIFAVGFSIFAPLNGVINDFIPKISVFSLGFGLLFIIGMFCKGITQKCLWRSVRANKLLFALLFLVCATTTVKYGVAIWSGSATTFFSYFAIPVYMLGAACAFIWIKEKWGRHRLLMQVYALAFNVGFLLFNDRYIMDVGGVIRAVGNYSNPNEMSIYAFCALVFSVCLVIENRYSTLVNIVGASVAMCALIFGQSRTALGAVAITVAMTVVSFMVWIIRSPKKHSQRKRLLVRGGSLIVLFLSLTLLFCRSFSPNMLDVTDIRGEYYTYIGRVEFIKTYPELREQLEERLRLMNPPTEEEDYFANTKVLPNEVAEVNKELMETTDQAISGADINPTRPTIVADETLPTNSTGDCVDSDIATTRLNFISSFFERLVSGNGTDNSEIRSNLRFKIWSGYLLEWEHFWLFGAENGFTSLKPVIDGTARDCHNTLLYILVQYGLTVTLLCIVVALKMLFNLLIRQHGRLSKVLYGSMLLGLIPFVLLNDLLNVAAIWLIVAVIGAAAYETDSSSEKSVAIIRRYSGMGGIENQILHICKELKKHGIRVCLITDQNDSLAVKAAESGASVYICSLNNPILGGMRVAWYCHRNRVDIVQSHMFYESILCRVVRFLSGSVSHVFRIHTYIDCSHISQNRKNLYHLLANLTDSKVDMYLAINDYNCREMMVRSHIPEHKIRIVHDGIPEIGEPIVPCSKKNKIAMIANLIPFKGHDTLVRGLELLRTEGIVLQVYLYGSCPVDRNGNIDTTTHDELSFQIKQLRLEDQVRFCGYTTNVRDSLNGIWALVLPSDSEGTPNCVLEAMSLKVLTICSNVGGVPEFVEDGVTGYLHEPKDARAFADAVKRAWNASAEANKKILNAAYQTWKKAYSLPTMINGLVESYGALIDQ